VGVGQIFLGVDPVITTGEAALTYQQDSKAAIEQIYRQYNDVIEEVFTGGITLASLESPASLTKSLIKHLDAIKSSNSLIGKFIENNRNYFEANIQQLAKYLGEKNILQAIKLSDKPLAAAQAMMNIFTQGLSNQWRETMYESIAGKTEISKVKAGLGVMLMADVYPIIYPKIGLSIRHRRNNYISMQNQKQLDANLINAGGIDHTKDLFLPEPPSVEAYAQYLKAIFSLGTDLEAKEEPT